MDFFFFFKKKTAENQKKIQVAILSIWYLRNRENQLC